MTPLLAQPLQNVWWENGDDQQTFEDWNGGGYAQSLPYEKYNEMRKDNKDSLQGGQKVVPPRIIGKMKSDDAC